MWATEPIPQVPAGGLALAGLGSLGVGAMLILRGRSTLGRIGLGVLAAAAGVIAAPHIAAMLPPLDAWVVAACVAVAGGLLAIVLARLLWTVLLAGLLAGAAMIAARLVLPAAWPAQAAGTATQPADWAAWAISACRWWQDALLSAQARPILLAGCAGALTGVAFGVYAPRGMTIFASSGIGALAAVAGVWACAWAIRPEWAQTWAARIELPAAAAAGLIVLGCAIQGRAEFKHRRSAAEAQKDKEVKA
jgi:hypothetical protein